jgi:hypothetical protein
MRFTALALVAIVGTISGTSGAQEASPTPAENRTATSPEQDATPAPPLSLPVSLDRIKQQLAHPPAHQLRGLDDRPTFNVEVQDHHKLEDLLASLDFKSGPKPAGGIYANEMQRVQFPSVDNPLQQPYAAFNQPELATIIVENLVGKYLLGRALDSITNAERARVENAAKDEVRQAISDYCAAQPNRASLTLCTKPVE